MPNQGAPIDHVVPAQHLLRTYEIRKESYEEGITKYPTPLYDAVCALVDRLKQLAVDERIRIDIDREGDARFIVARTGAEIARLPIALVRQSEDPSE